MKCAILCTILCVLVSASSVCADGPKLVNEKLILPDNENYSWKAKENKGVHSMRLSPDGKYLLYLLGEKIHDPEENRKRRIWRIVLRNIASGKDKTLPVPAYRSDEPSLFMLSMNTFDAAGKKIVLGAGIDANGDGLYDYNQEKMEPIVYDIVSGKTTKLPLQDDFIIPTFDRTGKKLIILATNFRARTGKLLTTPVEKVNLKQHNLWGLPRGICPTADILPLLLLLDPNADRRKKFILYDLKADRQITELPTHEKNTKLDDYNPQWTGNGRYLYYVDLKDDVAKGTDNPGTKPITRIWDRTVKKEGGIVDDAVAIGPGPGKTTMVLRKGSRRESGLILHDAATDKFWPLGDDSMRVIAAQGKYVIYAKKTPDGKDGAYMADIVLPGKAKDDKDKKPASQPAKTKPPKVKKP